MTAAITVTDRDYDQLATLIEAAAVSTGHRPTELEQELERARIVPVAAVPADVVTMNSTLTYEDLETGQRRTVTLVMPKDADIDEGRVSILTPVGAALIGLKVGETIERTLRDGTRHHLRLEALHHQPEAAGEAAE
jgi:regulator of nucleoside diphosphate kinase